MPAVYKKYLEGRQLRGPPLSETQTQARALQGERENTAPASSPADDDFAELVKKNKWKACEKCGSVIEKVSGCNHIRYVDIPRSPSLPSLPTLHNSLSSPADAGVLD